MFSKVLYNIVFSWGTKRIISVLKQSSHQNMKRPTKQPSDGPDCVLEQHGFIYSTRSPCSQYSGTLLGHLVDINLHRSLSLSEDSVQKPLATRHDVIHFPVTSIRALMSQIRTVLLHRLSVVSEVPLLSSPEVS